MATKARQGGKIMGWFCNKPEAKAQLKKCYDNDCPGCHKCIAIEESAGAMIEYGTITIEEHPLYNKLMEKFDGKEIN